MGRFKGKYVRLGGSPKPAGYCKHHKKTLSVHQIREKKCIQKQCNYFSKCKHGYWDIKEAIKKKKKEQKKEKDKAK